jgi:predicted O-methyltransferase YrrM
MNNSFEIAREIAGSGQYLKKNIVADKGLSVRYIFYRAARPFLKVIYKIFKWTNPDTPWTAQAAIAIFRKILTKDMNGLEYGSGNSTIFLAKHLKHLVSIEHDSNWFDLVRGNITRQKITNVDYRLIRPELAKEPAYSMYKEHGLSEDEFKIRSEYVSYFSHVRSYPDNHFDLIMVDGRARIECTLNAIPKLKPGGIFVLDNSDRKRYDVIFKVLAGWKKVTTTTGLFDTTFWFKP